MGGWCERVRQEVGAGRSKLGATTSADADARRHLGESHARATSADAEAPARPASASSARCPESLQRPSRPASAQGSRSGARDPGAIYGVSQQLLSRKARRSASAATLSSRAAPSVATSARPRRREELSAAATPAASYLRLLGLEQYTAPFVDAGLTDLGPIARLSSEGEVELLERLRPFPGHRAKLLRAIEGLRRLAALGRDAPDAADAVLEQLHTRHGLLLLEKGEAEEQLRILQTESHDRLLALQQRDGLVTSLQDRVGELEELTQSQTHQVNFLVMQLQRVLAGDVPQKVAAPDRAVSRPPRLPEGQAQPLSPEQAIHSEGASLVSDIENLDDGEAMCESPEVLNSLQNARLVADSHSRSSSNSGTSSQQLAALPLIPTPQRSTLVRPVEGASVVSCVVGESSEPAILCFAAALHQRLRTSAEEPAPAGVAGSRVSSIFDEPLEEKQAPNGSTLVCSSASLAAQEDGPSLLSGGCSALGMPVLGCPVAAPEYAEVRSYVQELSAGLRLQSELGVIAFIFFDRFCERGDVSLTAGNWRRLMAACLMLALKVWDDDPFENAELAQMCPYSPDDISRLETALLRGLRLDLSVSASAYAQAVSTLRAFATAAPSGKSLRPLDPLHASRLEARCRRREAELRRSGLAVGQSPRDATL